MSRYGVYDDMRGRHYFDWLNPDHDLTWKEIIKLMNKGAEKEKIKKL